ncbi:MAG: Two-component transcriptional response regulator, LuxR family, partial [uncultured Nocardioides sp.]
APGPRDPPGVARRGRGVPVPQGVRPPPRAHATSRPRGVPRGPDGPGLADDVLHQLQDHRRAPRVAAPQARRQRPAAGPHHHPPRPRAPLRGPRGGAARGAGERAGGGAARPAGRL